MADFLKWCCAGERLQKTRDHQSISQRIQKMKARVKSTGEIVNICFSPAICIESGHSRSWFPQELEYMNDNARYKVKTCKQTCGACPSQWDIFTDDDRYIYARYRWGWLSLTLNCGENNSQVIFAQAIGDELDGCMDLGELIAITSPLLDWSGDVIYN